MNPAVEQARRTIAGCKVASALRSTQRWVHTLFLSDTAAYYV